MSYCLHGLSVIWRKAKANQRSSDAGERDAIKGKYMFKMVKSLEKQLNLPSNSDTSKGGKIQKRTLIRWPQSHWAFQPSLVSKCVQNDHIKPNKQQSCQYPTMKTCADSGTCIIQSRDMKTGVDASIMLTTQSRHFVQPLLHNTHLYFSAFSYPNDEGKKIVKCQYYTLPTWYVYS